MTDQPKALLALLEEQCTIAAPVIRRRQQSRDGTVKYLLQLADGNCIETVLMRKFTPRRRTQASASPTLF